MRSELSQGTFAVMRWSRMISLLVLSLVLTALSVAAAGPGMASLTGSIRSAATPQTLVALDVPIREFAQDGQRLVWMTGRCRSYERPVDQVALQSIAGGRVTVLAPQVCGDDTSGWGAPFGDTGLALAGTRALFWWPVEGGNNTYHDIATAAVGKARRKIGSLVTGPDGSEITGVDGDGDTLVYGVATVTLANDCISTGKTCSYEVTGDVWRIVEGRAVPIRGVPAPAALDASATQIAIAPAQRRWSGRPWPVPAAINGPVQIRDSDTGALRAKFAPRGRVVDLALADHSASSTKPAASGSGTHLRSRPHLASTQ